LLQRKEKNKFNPEEVQQHQVEIMMVMKPLKEEESKEVASAAQNYVANVMSIVEYLSFLVVSLFISLVLLPSFSMEKRDARQTKRKGRNKGQKRINNYRIILVKIANNENNNNLLLSCFVLQEIFASSSFFVTKRV
jgi:hypothetical protein